MEVIERLPYNSFEWVNETIPSACDTLARSCGGWRGGRHRRISGALGIADDDESFVCI